MPRIRKKQISVGFHPRTHERLSKIAEEREMTINEIVRECVENDLPRLIERDRKRKNRRANVQ